MAALPAWAYSHRNGQARRITVIRSSFAIDAVSQVGGIVLRRGYDFCELRVLCTVAVAALVMLCLPLPATAQMNGATATVTGTVLDTESHPVATARISLIGPTTMSSTTDARGQFVFSSVPLGLYDIIVTTKNLGTTTRLGTTISGDVNVQLQYESEQVGSKLRVIGRTSTAAQGARLNVTPATVNQISAQAFADDNTVHLNDLLQTIPGVSVGTAYEQSSNVAGSDIASPSANSAYVSIRGALSYETAIAFDDHVLLGNGTGGSGFNVGYLTALGLQSLDVIKGPGALSPTINGAIGGTVDYRSADTHGKPTLTSNITYDGLGGMKYTFTSSGSTKNDRFGYSAGYYAYNSPGYFGNGYSTFTTLQFGETINGVPQSSYANNSGYEYGTTYSPMGTPPTLPYYGEASSLLLCCSVTTDLFSEHAEFTKLRYNLTPTTTLSGLFLGYQYNADYGTGYNLLAGPTVFTPDPSYVAPSAGPAPGSTQTASALLTAAESAHQNVTEVDLRQQIGAGSLRLSYLAAAYMDRYYSNLGAIGGSGLTFPGYGTAIVNGSTVTFDGTPLTVTAPFNSYAAAETYVVQKQGDGLLQYVVPIRSSVFSLAYDHAVSKPWVNGGNGASEPFPVTDQNGGQLAQIIDSYMLRGEFNIAPNVRAVTGYYFDAYDMIFSPLTSQLPNFVGENPLYLGSFTDHRSTYGTPRIGFTWRPSADISVRAGAGGAVAPLPLQNFVLSSTNTSPLPDNPASPTYYYYTLNNPNIRAETSFGYSAGIDARIRPIEAVASLDAYLTNVYGQFFTQTVSEGTYLNLPLYATESVNLSNSREEGIEASLRREVPKGIGFALGLGLQRSYTYNLPPSFYAVPGNPLAINLSVLPNENFRSGLTGGGVGFNGEAIPYANGSAEISYRFNGDGIIRLSTTYYGNNNGYYRPAFFGINAVARFPLGHGLALQLNAVNIGNVYSQFAPFTFINSSTQPGIPVPLANGQEGAAFGGVLGPPTLSVSLRDKL